MTRPIIGALAVCAFRGSKTEGPKNQWVGFSQFLPGGGAGPDATPFEKVYVMLEGKLTVIVDGHETVLRPMDSCTIAPDEVRKIEKPHQPHLQDAGRYPLSRRQTSGGKLMALDRPLSMFDVSGNVALITGASGAFGSVAAKCLSAAGCKVALAGGNAAALAEAAADCPGEAIEINARPETEAACADMVARTVAKFGRLDILVVASGMNKIAKIDEMEPATFQAVMDANVNQCWLMARAATKQMKAQGAGGKIVLVSSARGLLGPPCRLYRLLRVKGGCRRHDQGAGVRARTNRHHGQCDCPHGVSFAADGLDV